jgi:hypothetical protein
MAYINEMSGLTALKNMYSSEIGCFPVVRKLYCYTTAQYRYIHCALKIGKAANPHTTTEYFSVLFMKHQ